MEEIATVYARSLFEVAKEAGQIDVVREQLGEIADAVSSDRDLQVFLFSPYFSSAEKKDGLNKAITDADPMVVNFLEVLVENHRMPALMRVRRSYDVLWERENDLLPVSVTSAVELDEATVSNIGDRIGEQTGRKVQLTSSVDADLLGGIVVRVGNSIIDASIRNRLEQLRRTVAKAQ